MLHRKDRESFAGKTILKLYLIEKNSRKAFFFEDSIDKKDLLNFSEIMSNRITIKTTRGKTQADIDKFTNEELNLQQAVIDQDFWFGRVFDNSKVQEIQTNSVDANKAIVVPNSTPIFTTTPDFKTVGQQYYHNTAIGWFKDSYEWPAGSGNITSHYIRYNIISHLPEPGYRETKFFIRIEKQETYQYIASTKKLNLVDSSYSELALGTDNNSVKLGIETQTANGDYFILHEWTSSGAVNLDPFGTWFNRASILVSYIPIVNVAQKYVSEFISFIGMPTAEAGSEIAFYQSMSDQIKYYGNPIRAIGTEYNKKSLRDVNSELSIRGEVQKSPGGTSSKYMFFTAQIPIGSRWGTHYYTVSPAFLVGYTY